MAFCTNCGAQVQPGEKFCTSCGSKIEEYNAPAAESALTGAATAGAAAGAAAGAPAPGETPAPPEAQAPASPVYQQAPDPVYQAAPDPSYQQTSGQADAGAPGYAEAPADADAGENKGMSVLSYIGILVLIPLFFRKDSSFARFHINQGLVLMFIELASSLLKKVSAAFFPAGVRSLVSFVCFVVTLGCIVLSVMGLIAAAQGKRKTLPLIGGIKLI